MRKLKSRSWKLCVCAVININWLGFVNKNICFSLLDVCVCACTYTVYDNSIFGMLQSPIYVVKLCFYFFIYFQSWQD